jgi:hypothetical protein
MSEHNMISITGLTDRQRSIMDLLWGCQDLEQLRALIQGLPTVRDRIDAQGLIWIAQTESLELEQGLEEYRDAANTAINSARG